MFPLHLVLIFQKLLYSMAEVSECQHALLGFIFDQTVNNYEGTRNEEFIFLLTYYLDLWYHR